MKIDHTILGYFGRLNMGRRVTTIKINMSPIFPIQVTKETSIPSGCAYFNYADSLYMFYRIEQGN